jgi:hypothetical protein
LVSLELQCGFIIAHCTLIAPYRIPTQHILWYIMQNPTEDDEAPIPMETVDMNTTHHVTIAVRRKAAKLEDDESPIPIETVSRKPDMNTTHHVTIAVRRKAAKREDDEAPIPMETVSSNPNMNTTHPVTVAVRRKAAKRTLPWDLPAREINVISPSEAQEGPAAKKTRLEEPVPTTADKAAGKTASPGLPPPAADNADANANTDAVTDTQPNTGATRSWT